MVTWFLDKNGDLCYSDGQFHTMTRDWNYDNDVYTDTVMFMTWVHNRNTDHIHRYEINEFIQITQKEAEKHLREKLSKYFIPINDGYCDPRHFTKSYERHYGDYRFFPGGTCVYGKDRSKAIEEEVQYVINRINEYFQERKNISDISDDKESER